jgi:[amino group carrier protein]-lysine/ornithine hydrolase
VTGVESDPVELLTSSLKIYSPTSQESAMAAFLGARMKALGYSKVRTDRAGNVLGEAGSGGISLLLCGHMDTVPGYLQVRKTKGMIYGRGASDAKSPLCAMLIAGSKAAGSGVSITFAGVTQEEGDGRGIEQIVRRGEKFDYAVFGEPGSAQRMTLGYRGRVSVNISVKTHGGHAGSPWAHRSAFDEFSSFLERLRAYERSKSIPGDHYRSLSLTPTLVKAGSFHNVVPSLCEATLDLRVPPGMTVAAAVRGVRTAAEPSEEGVSIDVTPGEPTEPYEADPSSRIVRAFQRAILLRLGVRPGLVRKTGTGDMNTFAHRTGAACVTYGPGDSRTSHTDGEAVKVADYLNSIEVLTEAIRQMGALGSGISN